MFPSRGPRPRGGRNPPKPVWDDRDGVLPVVDVRRRRGGRGVGKNLIPDAGHAVADHPHVHAETDPEEDAVEERERSAERVVDGVY